jgi:hypothetical protein
VTTWVMLVTLISGQVVLGGEYQSMERCSRAIEMQRMFWAGQYVEKIECKPSTVDRKKPEPWYD